MAWLKPAPAARNASPTPRRTAPAAPLTASTSVSVTLVSAQAALGVQLPAWQSSAERLVTPARPVPVSTTAVPPAAGPKAGATALRTGNHVKVWLQFAS